MLGHRRNGSGLTWVRLAALGVCACAVVVGVSLAAFSRPATSSHGDAAHRVTAASGSPVLATPSTAAAAGAAQSAAPAPSVVGTTGTSSTGDGIASTAIRWPPGLNPRMKRWNTGPGGVALRAVTAQLGNAMQAAGVKLYPEARKACATLGSSVRTALAAPPIPYAAMQQLYGQVLAGLSGAATECLNAISMHPTGDEDMTIDLNKVVLNRSLAEFAAESNALYEATAEIRTLPVLRSLTRNRCAHKCQPVTVPGEPVY